MQNKRLQKLEDELSQLARQYPEVLGVDGFTSKVKGKGRRFLMDIRRRYYTVLRQAAEIRQCGCFDPTSKEALSSDVVKRVRDVTQDSATKSN